MSILFIYIITFVLFLFNSPLLITLIETINNNITHYNTVRLLARFGACEIMKNL